MNDFENLISIWQNNTTYSDIAINSLIKNKKDDIMDSIIKFENREKKEKQNQIVAALFLAFLTIFLVYRIQLDTLHFIGFILLIIGVSFNIIANKTDNFPDIRQLTTIDYLMAMKENTIKRSRMHLRNSVIGLVFLIPGCYLTFRNSFSELGNWWIIIVVLSGGYTLINWFRKYNKRSSELLTEVKNLIKEFELANKTKL